MQLILVIDDNSADERHEVKSSRLMHWIRSGQTLFVGRDRQRSDVVIRTDEKMSGAHFQVSCLPTGCRLADLRSLHGTFVNGVRVAEAELRHKDQIQAGNTHFHVEITGAAVDGPTSTPPRSATRLEREQPTKKMELSEVQASLRSLNEGPLPAEPPVTADEDSNELPATPGSMQVVLQIIEGPWGKNKYESLDCLLTWIRPGEVVKVGRSHNRSEMAIHRDREMSGSHFQLSCDGRFCRIRDLDSTNGTFLNGQRIKAAVLRDGDEIRAGRTNFVVRIDGGEPVTDQLRQEAFVGFARPGAARHRSDDSEGYRIINTTPFSFAPLVGRIDFAKHSLTLIVKATFRLEPGAVATLADEQLPPTGDEHDDSDSEQTGPLRYEGDFAYLKPRADVLLIGNRIGSADRPASCKRAELRVGSLTKTLEDDPLFTGFRPEDRQSERRRNQMGTYDLAWQQQRWPWFPVDFAWDYFNAAPRDLQVEGYLRGDEELLFKNIHPQHAEYRSRLPGIQVRCFLNPLGTPFHEVPMQLDTLWVDINNEQLVLVWRGHTEVLSEECENIRHVFVMTQNLSEPPLSVAECHAQLLDELQHREAESNPPPEQPEQSAGGSDSLASIVVAGVDTADNDTGGDGDQEESTREFQEQLSALQARIHDAQIAAGVDPQMFDRQVQAEQERLIREWGLNDNVDPKELDAKINAELRRIEEQLRAAPQAGTADPRLTAASEFGPTSNAGPEASPNEQELPLRWTRERVAEHLAAGGGFEGQDLSQLNLAGLDMSGADLRAAILTGCNLESCRLQSAKLELANLAGTNVTGADLRQATLNHADLTGATLEQARLDEVQAQGAIFATARLAKASMHRADVTGAYFTAADLSNANLSSVQASDADFTQAVLDKADLRFSVLATAEMRAVSARGARFDHADLTRLRGNRGDFSSAVLRHVQAPDSIWEKASLDHADLSHAQLHRANFAKASLEKATMHAADLSWGRLTKANLQAAKLTQMKLFEADLRQADLTAADISGSNLYGAEVVESKWQDTRRDAINLKKTKMEEEELAR